MSFLKLILILSITVNGISLHKTLMKEFEAVITMLEENEDDTALKEIEGLLNRRSRVPHIESQIYDYLHRLRQSYHKSSRQNAHAYINAERHRDPTLTSPHHRRIKERNRPGHRRSPVAKHSGR